MATMPPASLNGRPRKQLSDQLDRLDEVINGLEEFLPQAMADAARDGIRQAFRDVVSELITDPTTLDRIRNAIVPNAVPSVVPAEPAITAFTRLKARLQSIRGKFVAGAAAAIRSVISVGHLIRKSAADRYRTVKSRCQLLTLLALPLKSMAIVGIGIGVAVMAISYLAPHHVSAAISGCGASLSTMMLQVGLCLRRRLAMGLI
ncbi:hypothetical protein BH11PLA2_BH11PLA2_52340 [soil metagenome]